MQLIICDDDKLFIQKLQHCLQLFFRQHHLASPQIITFTNGEELLSYTGGIDILFLDIEMPGANGIYIGNILKERNKNIIIFVVTSYSEYLDDAMRIHVFRYLSKPLEEQRLFRNLKDALAVYYTLSQNIALETKEETLTIPVNDIIFIETQGRKTIVHTIKKEYQSIRAMQYWVEILPKNCFIQSHRSFIVNLKHVSNFNHDLIQLKEGQFTAYLAKRKYTEFKNAYLLYLESRE